MSQLLEAINESSALSQVICGNSLEMIKLLPDDCVDCIITDPPFDAHVHKTHGHRNTRNGFRDSEAIPFEPITDYDFVAEFVRIARRWVIIKCALEQLGDYRTASGDAWKRSGLWIKPDGVPQFTGDRPGQAGEGISCLHKGRSSWNSKGRHGLWIFNKPPNNKRWHATEMPLPLCEALIADFCKPGELILDPFAGSAAIGHAVLLSQANFPGLRYIGIELNPEFHARAARRLHMVATGREYTRSAIMAPTQQMPLFGGES